MRNCRGCRVAAVCRQFRARDCRGCAVSLHCRTRPAVEKSGGLEFGCFAFPYAGLASQMAACGLSPLTNFFADVHDFTPRPQEPGGGRAPNWRVAERGAAALAGGMRGGPGGGGSGGAAGWGSGSSSCAGGAPWGGERQLREFFFGSRQHGSLAEVCCRQGSAHTSRSSSRDGSRGGCPGSNGGDGSRGGRPGSDDGGAVANRSSGEGGDGLDGVSQADVVAQVGPTGPLPTEVLRLLQQAEAEPFGTDTLCAVLTTGSCVPARAARPSSACKRGHGREACLRGADAQRGGSEGSHRSGYLFVLFPPAACGAAQQLVAQRLSPAVADLSGGALSLLRTNEAIVDRASLSQMATAAGWPKARLRHFLRPSREGRWHRCWRRRAAARRPAACVGLEVASGYGACCSHGRDQGPDGATPGASAAAAAAAEAALAALQEAAQRAGALVAGTPAAAQVFRHMGLDG